MILVDTAVWIDHLDHGDPAMAELLETGQVLSHPWVIGEIALGHLPRRRETLNDLHDLPAARLAVSAELLRLIEDEALIGIGIGYVDVGLLASTLLTPDARL